MTVFEIFSDYEDLASDSYVYVVGETDLFYYARSRVVLQAIANNYPAIESDELPEHPAILLGQSLDHDSLEQAYRQQAKGAVDAKMVQLTEFILANSPAFRETMPKLGFNTIVYTAFRMAGDDGYNLRINGIFKEPALMSSEQLMSKVLGSLPLLRDKYMADKLSATSSYHTYSKLAEANLPVERRRQTFPPNRTG